MYNQTDNNQIHPELFYRCKTCGHEYYKTWSRCPLCNTPKEIKKITFSALQLFLLLS